MSFSFQYCAEKFEQLLTRENTRETWFLRLAVFIVPSLLLYFFVIEPLHKKQAALTERIHVRQTQTEEMQQMVLFLLANTENKITDDKADLFKTLTDYTASESLEDGVRIIITQKINLDKAKALFFALSRYGKTALHFESDGQAVIWFWQTEQSS